jgi:N-acetylmuramoyl-L-alanine amidase
MNSFNQPFRRRAFLKQLLQASGAITAAGLLPGIAFAKDNAVVKGARTATSDKGPQIIFDLSHATKHHVFQLHHPDRLVIDFSRARPGQDLIHPKLDDHIVSALRFAQHQNDRLRIVLDLKQALSYSVALLPPASGYPFYRLLVQFKQASNVRTEPVMSMGELNKTLRDVVVVIDPGHGGKDPGAIGKGRTQEKDVVLEIGRKLTRMLNKEKGIKVVMTRKRDHFLSLGERVRIAEKHKADLFVSIHADANEDRRISGSSVYILSEHGASSVMARRLAQRENNADLVGGVNLSGKGKTLASVLLDLSQTATLKASSDLAGNMLNNLDHVVGTLSDRIERAAFAVLKSPDIPSALVETAFISNPREERKLRTSAFQHQVAKALHEGILSFFNKHSPPGTLLSALNRSNHTG